MPNLSSDDIDHLARLARLNLSAQEKADFAKQLPEIIGFVDQLTDVSKSGEEELAVEPTPLAKLRRDEPSTDQLTLSELEQLAPAWTDSQLKVPAVFGEETDDR